MAFRRRRRSFRRRRARWDMQTWRECERTLNIDVDNGSTCDLPQIFADLVSGPISSTDSPMVSAATRAMMFGGGHLQIRYNSAIIGSTEFPCSFSVGVVTALVKLPLLEDDVTPAYLPNLMITRRQDSVVHATQSDTDEDILWLWTEQLDLLNVACATEGGEIQCPFDNSAGCTDDDNFPKSWMAIPAIAQYGRSRHDTTIRTRRRLREREALFLLTEFNTGGAPQTGDGVIWPVRRNVYLRYAVRPSR